MCRLPHLPLLVSAGLVLLGGCSHWHPFPEQSFPVREQIDVAVCELAARPADAQPLTHAAPSLPEAELPPPRPGKETPGKAPKQEEKEEVPASSGLLQTGGQEPAPAGKESRPDSDKALTIPPGLPGVDAPDLRLPPDKAGRGDRARAVERLFPPLAPLGPEPPLPPGPSGHPFSLTDLQQLAASNSPALRQAAAEVEEAKGTAVQAGLCPNPTVGYQADQIRQANTAGLQGAFIEQTIKTANKLGLARARAELEVKNAELAFKRARFDLLTQVRTGYFNVLASRENVRVARALVDFTDRVYRIQVDRLKAGQAALYEPAQLRVLGVQARNVLVQGRNREVAAWKSLAATLGLPALKPSQLAGRIDMPIPLYRYEAVIARALNTHTGVLTAQVTVQREQVNLRLQQVMPIPDVNLSFVAQKDYTTAPYNVDYNVRVGVPIPVWDKNQGNIINAQGRLERSLEGAHRARNELTTRLAEAFERYNSNRAVLENYQRFILPDQVRAFRGAYDRHQQEPERVGFGDIVNAQQTLAAAVTTYVTTLTAVWQAVVDVADVEQTEDLFQMAEAHAPAPVPELRNLPDLPCCHPCSPLPAPAFKGADGSWPARPVGILERPAGEKKVRTPAEEGSGPSLLPPPCRLPDAATPGGDQPRPEGVALPPLPSPHRTVPRESRNPAEAAAP